MDHLDYTTEHRKGQHLLSEERHEIEVRRKDGWSIYRIAKHLGRPYNTIKNEIARGTVSLYNGKVQRYKADEGKKVYRDHAADLYHLRLRDPEGVGTYPQAHRRLAQRCYLSLA
ncbi:MAG: helix-turn-helix domain-containing protein [Clostridia bacterium]|nr:helix-turn-helix domain-containing protein [Clostridia bacterium]